jgi:hypothetical protein
MSKMRWSAAVMAAKPPIRIDAKDFDPMERAFPFIGVKDRGDGYVGGKPPPIMVDDESVTFRLQRGPVAEVGYNGCQIDDMLNVVLGTLEVLNKKFPCRENSLAITKLQEALMWLGERTRDRQKRGVEGWDEE